MIANPAVALAINADVDNWNDVRGLQVEGEAGRVDGTERTRALALYLAKFAEREGAVRGAGIGATSRPSPSG